MVRISCAICGLTQHIRQAYLEAMGEKAQKCKCSWMTFCCWRVDNSAIFPMPVRGGGRFGGWNLVRREAPFSIGSAANKAKRHQTHILPEQVEPCEKRDSVQYWFCCQHRQTQKTPTLRLSTGTHSRTAVLVVSYTPCD